MTIFQKHCSEKKNLFWQILSRVGILTFILLRKLLFTSKWPIPEDPQKVGDQIQITCMNRFFNLTNSASSNASVQFWSITFINVLLSFFKHYLATDGTYCPLEKLKYSLVTETQGNDNHHWEVQDILYNHLQKSWLVKTEAVVLLLKYKPLWSPKLEHTIINQAWTTTDSEQDTAFTVFV